MIYKELIENIENRVGKFKSKGNIRMIKILEHFDNPCDSMKFIHIAGTNGKGSTSYFLYEILKSKFKVGLYTSPGLTSYRDRIVVGDLRISQSEFLSIGEEILQQLLLFTLKEKIASL